MPDKKDEFGLINGRRNTIFSLVPGESNTNQGICFFIYIERLSEYLRVSKYKIIKILPSDSKENEPWKGAPLRLDGFFQDKEAIDEFLKGLDEIK